jgi:serine/threonine-protein kinase RsbW
MRVNLVLEELALNVRDYGVVDGRRFDILIDSSPSSVKIDFADDGLRFDPTVEAPELDVESGIDGRSEGGLGVYIVKAITDELAYSYEMGKNRLTMSVARSG